MVVLSMFITLALHHGFYVLKQAIFGDELEDLRMSREDDVWQPLDFVLFLGPQQGSSGAQEIHAQAHLRVTCCNRYPDR